MLYYTVYVRERISLQIFRIKGKFTNMPLSLYMAEPIRTHADIVSKKWDKKRDEGVVSE